MRTLRKFRLLACLMSFWIALYPVKGVAEDIDIFVGSSAGAAANPNVLIVLDNTSNWARQSQQWPGGIQQGQAEANAIKTVINTLGSGVNVGLMEFVTGGNANDTGGFIRYAVRPMGTDNKAALSTKLTTIYNNVNGTNEKRNSNTPYGDLMYDVYNYFAGANVSRDGQNQTGTVNPPNPDADTAGYRSLYSAFSSPLNASGSCARNFQIFIGNPNSSGPASDSTDNTAAMTGLGCPTSAIALPTIGTVPTTTTTTLGNTGACYASQSAAQTAYGYGLDSFDNINKLYALANDGTTTATALDYRATCSGYTQGCTLGAAATTTTPMSCPAGTYSYHVMRTATTTGTTGPTAQTPATTSVQSSACYATSAAAAAALAAMTTTDLAALGLSCPTATRVVSSSGGTTTTTDTTHSCTYSIGSAAVSCGAGTNLTSASTTTGCYASSSDATTAVVTNGTDHGGMTCPTGYTCSYAVGSSTGSNCSGAPAASGGTTTSCYADDDSARTAITSGSDRGGLSCPSGYNCSYTLGGTSGSACSAAATYSTTTSCYAAAPTFTNPATSSSVATSVALTCPSGFQCDYAASDQTACAGSGQTTTGKTTTYYAAAPSVTSPASTSSLATSPSLSCPTGLTCTYSVGSPSATIGSQSTATSYSCYTSAPAITSPATQSSIRSKDGSYLTCPADSSCTYSVTQNNDSSTKDGLGKTCGATGSTGNGSIYTITQTVATTAYTVSQTASVGNTYKITQTPRSNGYRYTFTQSPVANTTYNVTQTAVPAAPAKYYIVQTDTPSVTVTTTGTATTDLGQTSGCYASPPSSTSDYASQCSGSGVTCTYNTGQDTTTNYCGDGKNQYTVIGQNLVYANGPTGTTFADTQRLNADDWARCLYQKGVPVSGGANQTVTTYTIDVYNKQPNNMQTSLLMSMARWGGGKYFAATNESQITAALMQIMAEIQSINSTFASASLPINATNRAQNENQVFIGMFRPDAEARPRWLGNVKRYQLIKDANGNIQLGDVNGQMAINNNTGFITECAMSWWTTDSSTYWQNYTVSPDPASNCATSSNSPYSDSPDGPRVEKGAVAEVIRRGNDPSGTLTTTWSSSQRNMYITSDVGISAFSAATAGWSGDSAAATANWVMGKDTEVEKLNSDGTTIRATVHGDVVHSRPLPINYCLTANCTGVVIYYGANDGTLRAVDAATGKEKWALLAKEFAQSRFERLRVQTPLVNYPNVDASLNPQARDYFWDGSIGLYQTASNDNIWIFPTMRRGGRMLYALDVSPTNADHNQPPAAPTFKWKFGCPNLGNDTGCITDSTNDPDGSIVAGIGQTWSIPNIAKIKGYSQGSGDARTYPPVAVVGGGYDNCEDANSASPSCGSEKGRRVFILNASSGALVRSFATLRAVVGDVALIDMDFDGYPDFGYVGDSGGNLYRISFSTYSEETRVYTPLASENWTLTRIAYTSGAGRKFLFSPSLFGAAGTVYIALGSGDREHPLQSQYPYSSFNGTRRTGVNGELAIWNRFYVYRDCLKLERDVSLEGGDNLDSTTLMTNATSDTADNGENNSCGRTSTSPSNCSTNKGWFVDLNSGAGEQTVTSAVIAGGMVTFSTNRPVPAAAGTCSTPLGKALGYWLNLYNGAGAIAGNCTINGVAVTNDPRCSCGGAKSAEFVGGGLPPSPVIGTVPINGTPTSVVLGAVQRTGAASSPISPQKATPTTLPARKRIYTFTKGNN